MCGIHIFLGIYLYFIANKYAYVESVMSSWLFLTITGFIMFYIVFISNEKQKFSLILYSIGVIIIGILIFISIPTYSYKEAVEMIEYSTGEKTINTQNSKVSIGYYYIYTVNETYLFDPWSGEFVVIPKIN